MSKGRRDEEEVGVWFWRRNGRTRTGVRERGAEGGHRRLLMSPGAEEGLPRPSMSQGTDTRPQEAPPMTETDTSHAPGPGHPLPESVTDQT